MISESTRLNELPAEDLLLIMVSIQLASESTDERYKALNDRYKDILAAAYVDSLLESKRLQP